METKNKIALFGVVVTLFLGVGSWYFSAGGKEYNIDVYGELIENVYSADGDINIKYENRDTESLLKNHNIEYNKLDKYPIIRKEIKSYITVSNYTFKDGLINTNDNIIGTEKYNLEDNQYIFINSIEQNETLTFITMYDINFTCYCRFVYWTEREILISYECSDMVTEEQKKLSLSFLAMECTWISMFDRSYSGKIGYYEGEEYAMSEFKQEDKYFFIALKRELNDFAQNDPEISQKARDMYERYKNTE